jgi:hypothetical protein
MRRPSLLNNPSRYGPVRRAALSLAAGCLLAGCIGGNRESHVTGTVTFDGKPVPAGKVYFTPDASKGRDGPQGYADIKDGAFDTRQGGKNPVSGPMVVRVEGFEKGKEEGLFGKPLFAAYEIRLELPDGPSEQKLEVPASAARDLQVRKGPQP